MRAEHEQMFSGIPGDTTPICWDLVFALFFEKEQELGTEETVFLIQSLLLDPRTCKARIAVLEQAAVNVRQAYPDGLKPPPRDFTGLLSHLRNPGTVLAWQQGLVTFEDLEALTRNPAALRAAQEQVLELLLEPPPAVAEKSATAAAGRVLQENQRTVLFRQRLKAYPLLPELLPAVALGPEQDRAFLEFLSRKLLAEERGQRGTAETLLDWLRDFARERQARGSASLSEEQFRTIVCRVVAREQLEQMTSQLPHEKSYRQAMGELLDKPFYTAQELLEAMKALRLPLEPKLQPLFEQTHKRWLDNVVSAIHQERQLWQAQR